MTRTAAFLTPYTGEQVQRRRGFVVFGEQRHVEMALTEFHFNFRGPVYSTQFSGGGTDPGGTRGPSEEGGTQGQAVQAYLRRKTSGAQKRYADKIKAGKKAEMDAKKDAIRAEDIEKGVLAHVKDMPHQEPKRPQYRPAPWFDTDSNI